MVLTTVALSPSVIPFATTFSGPLPPPIQEQILPEITSPPIEEDIANPAIVHTVLNLGSGPRLGAYPLGTPDLEQVMAVALRIAHDRTIPCLQLDRTRHFKNAISKNAILNFCYLNLLVKTPF
ncbi:hypothetical protein DSO57_1006129 [Entomophthora muscae]|uniref:Uncharacterized protein n=1 Tax=Entomophthora muscae TaxID=34485 RepID=A0ACC2UGQ8_9FUNG|nr:hypothetical protein DSO57_1006129 [Entomophthora muscae]